MAKKSRAGQPMDESLKCAREKYWSELDQAQKVERTRGVVKRLLQDNRELRQTVSELVRVVSHHEHGVLGTTMTPVRLDRSCDSERLPVEKGDDVFF